MKRTFCILLSLMLTLTGLAGLCVPAIAAYGPGLGTSGQIGDNVYYNTPVPVRLIPDETLVRPGDTVTYTVKIGPVTDMVGADLWLGLPDGLTVGDYDFSAEYAASNPDATLQFSSAQNHFIIYSIQQTPYTTAGETDLMTFTCTVGSEASGEMIIELPRCELAVSSQNTIPCAYDPAGSAVTVVTNSSAYKTGDLVEFGSYPQTRVTDDATIDALNAAADDWKSYGYCSGTGDENNIQMTASGYMKYCDVTLGGKKYRGVKFTQYRPVVTYGVPEISYQDENGYHPGNVYWFRYESLQWRMLDPQAGLMLCESVIDVQAYQNVVYEFEYKYYLDEEHTIYANNYENSDIRVWLNGDFMNTAFSAAQQYAIKPTVCTNGPFPTDDPQHASAATTDQVFLLSESEATNTAYGFSAYISRDPARVAKPTDYALCQGVDTQTDMASSDGSVPWLLRTAKSSSNLIRLVDGEGVGGWPYVYSACFGIRPAITVDLDAVYVPYHDGDIIEFGTYLQGKLVNEDSIAALEAAAPDFSEWTSYGYYVGNGNEADGSMAASDYMRYCEITLGEKKYRGVRFTQYRPWKTGLKSTKGGSSQDDNGYETNTTYWFRYRPLQWRVLDAKKGILLCESIIDSQPMNNYLLASGTDGSGNPVYWGDANGSHYANNYAHSSLRQWLNNDFLNAAFSTDEQAVMKYTTLDNSADSTVSGPEYGSEATNDRVYLLSYADAQNAEYGFLNNESRRMKGSGYSKCQGLAVTSSYSPWLLRTPGSGSREVILVNNKGVFITTNYSNVTNFGIRPAISVDMHALYALSHEHTYGEPVWKWADDFTSATMTLICTECGDVLTMTDNAPTQTTVTEPDCTNDKVVTYTASLKPAGKTYKNTTDPVTVPDTALGHDYSVEHETVAPTATEEGYTLYKCSRCGEIDPTHKDIVAPLNTRYNVGDIVEFGSYPQSRVTDDETIDALNNTDTVWNSYDYYLGSGGDYWDGQMTTSDYMQYCDVTLGTQKYRGVRFSQYRPYRTGNIASEQTTYQDDNGYMPNTTYWFLYEPLQWRVLDPVTGLVLCESIIDSQAYNNYYIRDTAKNEHNDYYYWGDPDKSYYPSNYEKSSIRAWLNDDFYTTAFTVSQGRVIIPTTLDNSAYSPDFNCPSTTDNVFLPSYSDMVNKAYGFSADAKTEDPARQAFGTDYAKCQGLYVRPSNQTSIWRLRTAYDYYISNYNVLYSGNVDDSNSVSATSNGIRPAITADLEALTLEIYKTQQKSAVDTMQQNAGSDACPGVFRNAKDAIDAVIFDAGKTMDENKAVVDAIVTTLANGPFDHTYGDTGDDRFTCTVCGHVDDDLKAAAELADAKAAAKEALATYKNADDYRADEKADLAAAISDGKDAIDGAADIAAVTAALNNAKAVIDAIKTDAQLTAEELAAAKETAKTELAGYKNADDYRADEKADLAAAVSDGNDAIDRATDSNSVTDALNNAKAVIDAIKTDAQLTAEELAAAKETLAGAIETAREYYESIKDDYPVIANDLDTKLQRAEGVLGSAATIDEVQTMTELAGRALDAAKDARKAADVAAFEAYKESVKTLADGMKKEGDSTACTALVEAAKEAVDAVTYDESKTLDENKDAVDNAAALTQLASALAEQRAAEADDPKEAFEEYRATLLTLAEALRRDGDSEAVTALIDDAVAALTGFGYDEEKTLAENEDALSELLALFADRVRSQRRAERQEELNHQPCSLCGEHHTGSLLNNFVGIIHGIIWIMRSIVLIAA